MDLLSHDNPNTFLLEKQKFTFSSKSRSESVNICSKGGSTLNQPVNFQRNLNLLRSNTS